MDAVTPQRELHNLDIEQALLGSLLMDNDVFPRMSALSASHFFEPMHGRIFEVCATRIAAGEKADVRTIKSFLNANMELGSITVREYVARLVGEAAGFASIDSYVRLLIDLSLRRKLLDVAREAETSALEAPLEAPTATLLEAIEDGFSALRQAHHVDAPDYGPVGTMKRAMDIINESHMGRRVGHPWLLPEITRVMDGQMQPGNLYGLLGASGDGKSSFVLQTMRVLSEQGIPVFFLSGEQEPEVCALQMQAQRLGIPLAMMLKQDGITDEEADRIFEDAQALAKLPWAVTKWASCRVSQLGVKIRSFVKRYGPGVVAIDHAKKIAPDNPKDNLAQQVSQVFGGVKDLMGETGCAGILIMQRNSEFLKRRNMWPIRSDCYGGEGTLQNLDGCLTLFRASRWLKESLVFVERGKERDKIEERVAEEAGRAWFGNLKNRYGEENRRDKVLFEAQYTRFVSYEQRRLEKEPELPV